MKEGLATKRNQVSKTTMQYTRSA